MHSGFRYLTTTLLAVLVTLSAFYLMQKLVGTTASANTGNERQVVISFTDVVVPVVTEKPRPVKPPPPPKPVQPPPPPKPVIENPKPLVPLPPTANIEKLNIATGAGNTFWTPGVPPDNGTGDGEIIPIVRIQPPYPRDALVKKIEGWVTVQFTINTVGLVSKPVIIDGSPRGVFDHEAKRTILKWKFKPRMVDGQAVEQQATQTFDFSLEQS